MPGQRLADLTGKQHGGESVAVGGGADHAITTVDDLHQLVAGHRDGVGQTTTLDQAPHLGGGGRGRRVERAVARVGQHRVQRHTADRQCGRDAQHPDHQQPGLQAHPLPGAPHDSRRYPTPRTVSTNRRPSLRRRYPTYTSTTFGLTSAAWSHTWSRISTLLTTRPGRRSRYSSRPSSRGVSDTGASPTVT